MNLVAMIGNVSAEEINIHYTSKGKAICDFKLIVAQGGHTETFNVVCYDRQAEIANEYLTPGRRVGIEGKLTVLPKSQLCAIVAGRIQLLGSQVKEATH